MMITTKSGYSRPTFEEILAGRQAAYLAKFGPAPKDGTTPRLAEIDANAIADLYAFIENTAEQFMPLHASGQWLLDWGEFLIGKKKDATAASGSVKLSGTNGVDVTAGTVLRIGSTLYTATSTVAVTGGSVVVPIGASALGTGGNAAAGTTIALVSPIIGLDSDGVVLAPGLTGGHAAETLDEYQARTVERVRTPPAGGNDADYIAWAEEVAGVTRAWVQRGADGSGEVLVLIMMDDTYADGLPRGSAPPGYSGDLLTTYTHIRELAPDPAVLYVAGPTPKVIEVTIQGLSPDTPEMRAAVEAQLRDVIRRRAEPNKVFRKGWVAEAIALAAGEDGYDDLVAPAASVACGRREIAVLGAVRYV